MKHRHHLERERGETETDRRTDRQRQTDKTVRERERGW